MNAGVAERVTTTTDNVTEAAVEGIATLLRAEGFAVERRAFVRVAAEELRGGVLLALERPLSAIVALLGRHHGKG